MHRVRGGLRRHIQRIGRRRETQITLTPRWADTGQGATLGTNDAATHETQQNYADQDWALGTEDTAVHQEQKMPAHQRTMLGPNGHGATVLRRPGDGAKHRRTPQITSCSRASQARMRRRVTKTPMRTRSNRTGSKDGDAAHELQQSCADHDETLCAEDIR
ncbi:unnamed protein product [Prorocentrum cordatum]|uniref:Uncharacterized protein n=1 Tax=Prorocentrum cordatum TaxID=2364126 RepID=A0ABN9RPE9_9DINO|nr:unnamed protein product [Polarella glacialis]